MYANGGLTFVKDKEKHLKNPITNLYNRTYYNEIEEQFARKMIEGKIENAANNNSDKTWSVLFCDMDGLKTINDTLGHKFGDKGLELVANIIQQCIRSTPAAPGYPPRNELDEIIFLNEVFSYGGDEFLVILPNCVKEKAVSVYNRIKTRIAKEKDILMGASLSIGIADTNEVNLPQDINNEKVLREFISKVISIAENRMYAEKNVNISTLPVEERETIYIKNLNRIKGFDLSNPECIDDLIRTLEKLKLSNKQK